MIMYITCYFLFPGTFFLILSFVHSKHWTFSRSKQSHLYMNFWIRSIRCSDAVSLSILKVWNGTFTAIWIQEASASRTKPSVVCSYLRVRLIRRPAQFCTHQRKRPVGVPVIWHSALALFNLCYVFHIVFIKPIKWCIVWHTIV